MVVGVAGEGDNELVFVDNGVAGFLDDELDGVAGGFGGEVEGEGAVGFGGCGLAPVAAVIATLAMGGPPISLRRMRPLRVAAGMIWAAARANKEMDRARLGMTVRRLDYSFRLVY